LLQKSKKVASSFELSFMEEKEKKREGEEKI